MYFNIEKFITNRLKKDGTYGLQYQIKFFWKFFYQKKV